MYRIQYQMVHYAKTGLARYCGNFLSFVSYRVRSIIIWKKLPVFR
jgi:hypothetical protein